MREIEESVVVGGFKLDRVSVRDLGVKLSELGRVEIVKKGALFGFDGIFNVGAEAVTRERIDGLWMWRAGNGGVLYRKESKKLVREAVVGRAYFGVDEENNAHMRMVMVKGEVYRYLEVKARV